MATDTTPDQPTPDEPHETESEETGLKKLLLGCGCGVLVMVLVCTGAAGALWYTSSTMLPDEAEQLVRQLTAVARQADEPTQIGSAGMTGEMLDRDEIPNILGEPLSVDETRQFLTTLRELTNTDAFQTQKKTADDIRGVAKTGTDAGPMDRIKGVWSIGKYATQTKELEKAFQRVVGTSDEAHQQFFSRLIRIAALMAAADHIAGDLDSNGNAPSEPLSDAVANAMVERRPDLAKKYDQVYKKALAALEEYAGNDIGTESRKGLRALGRRLDELQPALKMASQPGLVAFARLDSTTFDTWAALGTEQRQQLVDQMRQMAALFPVANAELGLKAFQLMLTTPERARLR